MTLTKHTQPTRGLNRGNAKPAIDFLERRIESLINGAAYVRGDVAGRKREVRIACKEALDMLRDLWE